MREREREREREGERIRFKILAVCSSLPAIVVLEELKDVFK